MYEDDGWTVDINKMTLTRHCGDHHSSRGIPPDGQYDGWYPLPITAQPLPQDSHEAMIARCQEINKQIAQGHIYPTMPCGDCPSAWLDYDGNARNARLYKAALLQARQELATGQQLYIRQGSRFQRV